MALSQDQVTKSEDRLTRLCLFLGMLLWFVDLNAVYALPSLACEWNWFRFTVAGISGLAVIEAVISLVAMALMAPMIYVPWRNWRKFQTQEPTHNPELLKDTEKDRRSLLAFVAMLLNSFFFLFMVTVLVPIFTLNACARG